MSERIITFNEVSNILSSLNLMLTNDEVDYIVATMYKTSRNTEKLNTKDMFDLFKAIISDYAENQLSEEEVINEDIPEEVEEKRENAEIIEENIKVNKEHNKRSHVPVSHSLPQEKSDNSLIPDGNFQTEEEIIEIAQRIFGSIAFRLNELKISPMEFFVKDIVNNQNGDEGELIPSDKFLEKLNSLELPELSPRSQECLLKILSATEDGEFIRFTDFVQVMEDFKLLHEQKDHSFVY